MIYNLITSILVASTLFSSQLLSQINGIKDFTIFPEKETKIIRQPQRVNFQNLDIALSSQSVIVRDEKSNSILYGKNINDTMPLASITKLMTAIVFLDSGPDWERVVEIRIEDQRDGNRIYLIPGDEVSVRSLFDLMLIASSNEATVALVRSTGYDNEKFVALMNKKAKALGLKHTLLYDPTGLDIRNTSSVHDISLLSREAFRKLEIRKIANVQRYDFKILNTKVTKTAINTNKLLEVFSQGNTYKIIAAKTGYLDESGYNITIEISQDNHPVIITVLGSRREEDRWNDVVGLTEWIYKSYSWDTKG